MVIRLVFRRIPQIIQKMTTADSNSLFTKYIKIAAVVAIYWIISIVTVFVNKALLSSDTVQLDAPLFVTWIQCIISVVICLALGLIKRSYLPNPYDVFSENIIKTAMPVAILFTAMISLNNLCLKHVPVSFYYIGRSLTTVFNVILSYTLLGQTSSFNCILCCAIIVGGFWLGVDQESVSGSFSLLGTIFGVLGSISLSLYSIYTKKTLPKINDQVLLLNYYVNVYAIFLFIPLMLFSGEIRSVFEYRYLNELWLWMALSVGGICGFSIGYVTALQIKVTSPLTHNISGTAKACAQTVLASTWNHENRSTLWWLSNVVVLFGSSLYARVKQLEMDKNYSQQLIQSDKV
ncbi:GDP-fucose transporter 1 [Contarinia nasturtii]|uniref:GDP-fucose transporter 1 n=1 Tax=Contarinia nasturtii TaxID=265458 RepID=UPI0012D47A48|nr:GDP-fucose transporter 1 [Contarinia nasturtii]